ncbi:unnamed protein product, partial [Closterium sp. NIES-64]
PQVKKEWNIRAPHLLFSRPPPFTLSFTTTWRHYTNPGYLDALKHLTDFKEEGKIKAISCPPFLFAASQVGLCQPWVPGRVEAPHRPQGGGKIKAIGLTNFDTTRLQVILENGIPIVSNQVQHSLVDMREAAAADGLRRLFPPFPHPPDPSQPNSIPSCLKPSSSLCFKPQVQHSLVDMRPQQQMAQLCALTGVQLIT